MNPIEQVNAYLRRLESRLRAAALSRGLAIAAATALGVTLLLAIVTNGFAFSDASVGWARFFLFLALALAAAFGIVAPALRLNRLRAARRAERAVPDLEQRLLTVAEPGRDANDPFVQLLAGDALEAVRDAHPTRVVPARLISGFLGAAAASAGVLLWLVLAGPGFLGHGASLLWAGPTKPGARPYYEIAVSPGNRTVRRKADQLITATLAGFQAPRIRLFARYNGASKWETVEMQPQQQGAGYEFLFAGIPESFDYYVEASGVRSAPYKITVRDLPNVKNIRVTYHFPKWAGMEDAVEDPGGDLRAVQGTEAEVKVVTDRPLANGVLVLDGGERIPLTDGAARVPIQKEGTYHIAAAEPDELVRLTDDYFIEAREDEAPTVRITRGRDIRALPIEEVSIEAEARDDFGLREFSLKYSVNGGPEQTVPLPRDKGKDASGRTVIALEDYNLSPGDIVAVYATAADASRSVKTDMYFIQAEPYERSYSQSQQAGGGGGEGEDGNGISNRQKEIIAATWNQLRQRNRAAAAENARFLSDVQAKLRDQARSLAQRMRSRELSQTNQEFQNFSREMEQAAQAMTSATDKLRQQKWQEALQPEQKALQHLLRAEAMFRDIQVAFGRQGGGGGGQGGSGRDLENLFDLELDTEKNQYETGSQSAADQREREIDEAFQKLEQLARRQQELAREQRQQQSFQQRWQQEMLRREAEQLRRRIEELARGESSSSSQSGQQGQQSQQSQQAQGSSSGRGGGQSARQQQLQRALDELSRAMDDMRRANAPGSEGGAEARRAAERLEQARRVLERAGQDQAQSQVDDLARRSARLNDEQRQHMENLRKLVDPERQQGQRADAGESQQLAERRDRMLADLQALERDLQSAARSLAGAQRDVSSKLRDALGNLQQDETRTRMKYNNELVRRGLGAYTLMREAPVTRSLQELDDQLRQAQSALGRNPRQGPAREETERALAEIERLRRELESRGNARNTDQLGRSGQGGQPGDSQQGGDGQRAGDGRGGDGRGGDDRGNRVDEGGYGGSREAGGLRWGVMRLRNYLQNHPELARRIESASPSRLLIELEQAELQLRRELNDGASEVLSGAPDAIPPGYADAVAEYFRKLSKGKSAP